MKHLSEAELVDYTDGALPAARVAHLDDCSACRARADSLADAIAGVLRTTEHGVPEPSPLFWEHFSQRVRDGVHEVDVDVEASAMLGARGLRAPAVRWAAALAVVLLAITAVLWTSARRFHTAGPVASVAADRVAPAQDVLPIDPDDDEEWALVRVVADGLQWEDAHEAGLTAGPGSAEQVALEMSPAERHELARLLEDEIKRPGA